MYYPSYFTTRELGCEKKGEANVLLLCQFVLEGQVLGDS